MTWAGGPLVVLGVPCAGKTTLAAGLAARLGLRHLSVGELIRSARESDEGFRSRSEDAYLGRCDFDPADLARLISAWAARDGAVAHRLVVDAGPPIDRVAEILGWHGIGTLVVVVDEPTAAARLRQRQGSGVGRADDIPDLFWARAARSRRRLPAVVARLSNRGWASSVVGTAEPESVLRQALSAIELHRTMRSRRAAPAIRAAADYLEHGLARMRAAALDGDRPVDVVLQPQADEQDGRNAMVLLCKPRVALAPDVLRSVDLAARRFGYRTARISAWSGSAVARAAAAEPHFDFHGQVSRWGSSLAASVDAEMAARILGGTAVLGGHEYLRAFGAAALDQVWREESANPPRQVGGRFWALEPPGAADVLLLNGHMPAVLADYARPDSVVYAMLLTGHGSSRAADWSAMRQDFLGHTDPAKARPGSLRARAIRADLLRAGRGSFRNNVFHLSRGPLEAVREAGVWFGPQVLADVACRHAPDGFAGAPSALAVDWPLSAERWSPWAFETTALADAGSPAVAEAVQGRGRLEDGWRLAVAAR
jgi:adenylate kinase family enzyme